MFHSQFLSLSHHFLAERDEKTEKAESVICFTNCGFHHSWFDETWSCSFAHPNPKTSARRPSVKAERPHQVMPSSDNAMPNLFGGGGPNLGGDGDGRVKAWGCGGRVLAQRGLGWGVPARGCGGGGCSCTTMTHTRLRKVVPASPRSAQECAGN